MIKGILYDLDNTLCYCADWHKLALNKALKEICGFEISEDEHISTFNGLPTKKKLDLLINQRRIKINDYDLISQKKQEYTKDIIFEEAIVDPIKVKLHRQNKLNGLKSACVTNSITETAALILEKTGQLQYMDFLISNEVVKYPKPHGEGYIISMIKLGIYPSETLIVEDSPVGIQAAKSTGAHVWEVKDSIEVTYENFQQFISSINIRKV